MNSPSSRPLKYTQLIESGLDLFRRFGVRRVTVEEICRHAVVSKMTFYKYFRNKNDLVKTILDDLIQESYRLQDELQQAPVPFTEKVQRIIQFKAERARDLSGEFINDIYRDIPELKEYMGTQMQIGFQRTMAFFNDAQKQGQIRQDIHPSFLLYVTNQIVNWYLDPELQRQYETQEALVTEIVQFYFYGICTDSCTHED